MPSMNYSAIMSEAGVKEIATYASGVGPWKNTLVKAKAGANVVRHIRRPRQFLLMTHSIARQHPSARACSLRGAAEHRTFIPVCVT